MGGGDHVPVLLEEAGSYVMYMRSPLFASQLPRGKSWIRLDLSRQTASLGVDFSSLVSTSQTFAPLEKGMVSTKRKGRAVVAGRPTTQYRAIIDVKRAARLVPAYGKQVAAIQRAPAQTSVNVATGGERDEIAVTLGGLRFEAG